MGFNYLGGKRAIRDDDPHFGPFYQSGNVGWNGFLKRFVARSARVTSFERIVKREMVAGEKRLLFLNGSWLCFPIDVREQRPKTILRMGIVKAFFSRPRRRKTAENQDFAISGNKGSKGMLHGMIIVTGVFLIEMELSIHAELLNALAQLGHKGMKGLVIDLRGNLGGYMETAIQMANEFLPAGKLIVFAKGRKYPRTEEYANGSGSCQKLPLIVLIDEGSASSSEIFSGAIQDNDRGIIVGRRSFGKGLVQQPISFSDGSMIRLTIARYYTPSGRCIQRPYTRGNDEKYEMDLLTRYQHVPGSFELTFGAQQFVKQGNVDAVIILGCVVKGETPHFDYVCMP